MDKGLTLLLQGEIVLHVMLVYSIEVVVLYEILLGSFALLSWLVDDILILYFH